MRPALIGVGDARRLSGPRGMPSVIRTAGARDAGIDDALVASSGTRVPAKLRPCLTP